MPVTNNKQKLAIGLMSGTSLDGIDAALIKSDGVNVMHYGIPLSRPYDRHEHGILKITLSEARCEGQPTNKNTNINETSKMITDLHIEVVKTLLRQNDLSPIDIDVIGFHGQTLLHNPGEGWSWQIGDGNQLSKELGIQVVSDFRKYDVSNGGQGAPLVPVYHKAVFSGRGVKYPIGLINFGGVANVTWIGSDKTDDLIAFDTGPANALLDDWVRRNTDYIYDKDGIFSQHGTIHQGLIEKWINNDYFKQPPPKSLDRDYFNVDEVNSLSLEDGAATLAGFSVACLKEAINIYPKKVNNWYVSGGGAHNPTIMTMLNEVLGENVKTLNTIGLDGDYIEAEAFGYMAVRRLYDLPITFPGTTGISSPSTGGVISKP